MQYLSKPECINMKLNKKDIKLFRTVCLVLCFLSVLVIVFISKTFGSLLLAASLYFLFTPYSDGDEI